MSEDDKLIFVEINKKYAQSKVTLFSFGVVERFSNKNNILIVKY